MGNFLQLNAYDYAISYTKTKEYMRVDGRLEEFGKL
jgi:hypothetical protein